MSVASISRWVASITNSSNKRIGISYFINNSNNNNVTGTNKNFKMHFLTHKQVYGTEQ